MTQQSGNQFDDDLTVGFDNDGSFSTDSIDLFEFTSDEESPIARLKTIILSIDWEINDEILGQLEDELVDLSDIWADDKIKLVYIQGLSKIGKYIYKERANAHPNSIKLLITFYHNLEKIVSSGDLMSEDEKKQLLVEDVKKFDQLKSQIGSSAPKKEMVASSVPVADDISDGILQLKKLKAQVLGIDWEINDTELQKLSDEVQRLESIFAQSKAKLILLQGIGSLGSYINKMRSGSNSKAFTLLHSFYNALETIFSSGLSTEDEKRLLLSEVEKFKSFKAEISQVHVGTEEARDDHIPPEQDVPLESEIPQAPSKEILPVDKSMDEIGVAADVDDRLASVFGDISEDDGEGVDASAALQGVDVETEADDDSEEDALPYEDGSIAPALAEADEESSFSVEKLAGDLVESIETEVPDDIVESESILPGVDVETEADDDSDEDELPFEGDEIAPALSGTFSDKDFEEDSLDVTSDDSESDDLDSRLDSFFDDEVQTSSQEWSADQKDTGEEPVEEGFVQDEDGFVAALSGITEEDTEEDTKEDATVSDDTENVLVSAEEEIPAALSDFAEDEFQPVLEEPDLVVEEEQTEENDSEPVFTAVEEPSLPEGVSEENVEEQLSFFDEEEAGNSEPDEPSVVEDMLQDENPEDQLSFLDEEIPAPESTESADDIDTFFNDYDDDVEEALSYTDTDTSPTPALSSELEDVDGEESRDIGASFFEDADGPENTLDEESLSFFDEEKESLFEEEPGEAIVLEEGDEGDEIQFTVPGEIAAVDDLQDTVLKESSFDDIIEFNVPGEEDSSEVLIDSIEDSESSEVVFEVVDDDVEVDPLPGEEYADEYEDLANSDQKEDVVFLEAQDVGFSVEDFQDINLFIGLLKDDITEDGIQNVLTELNSLRNNSASTPTIKIFLQLLSTVCQNLEKITSADSIAVRLELIEEIYSGLESCVTPEITIEAVQTRLLGCTTRVLLMQNNEVTQTESLVVEEEEEMSAEVLNSVSDSMVDDSTDDEEIFPDESTERDDQLREYVHEELADIKKLFIDEIAALRKEFIDK